MSHSRVTRVVLMALCFVAGSVRPVAAETEPQAPGDVVALLASLDEAVAERRAVFSVPPGVYQFGRRDFQLKHAQNLEIDGQGATFVFGLHGGRMRLLACRNVTVRNLFLDMERPPFIQGTIRAVDPVARTVDFTIDAGFPSPVEAAFGAARIRHVIMDREAARELPLPDIFLRAPIDLAPGIWRAQADQFFLDGSSPLFAAGHKIVLAIRGSGGGVSLSGSAGITLEDVVVHAAGDFAFHESGKSDGGNVYRRCQLTPRAPSLWAGAADAFHSMNQRRGPQLLGCEFSWAFDDLINIHGFINLVLERKAADTLLIAGPFERDFEIGDTLRFYRHPDAAPVGEARVIEITSAADLSRAELERRAATYFSAADKDYPVRSFPRSQPSWVKFDRAVEVKDFDLAVSSAYAGSGAVIENCHLHHGHVRGILLKAPGATLRNCRIEHTHRAGIALCAEQFWLEGPFPAGIMIADNVLTACGFGSSREGAITTSSEFGVPRRRLARAYNITELEITGNRIVDAPGVAIQLANADGVLIQNNTLINPLAGVADGRRPNFSDTVPAEVADDVSRNPNWGIVTLSSRNVRGSGNRAEGTPEAWLGLVGIGPWSENVRVGLSPDTP